MTTKTKVRLKQIRNRVIFWSWPLLEVRFVSVRLHRKFNRKPPDVRWTNIYSDVETAIQLQTSDEVIESLVGAVWESEMRRLRTVEEKASQYQGNVGLLIVLFSYVPILLLRVDLVNWWILGGATVPLVLGYLYLLGAIFGAIGARRVVGLSVPNHDECKRLLSLSGAVVRRNSVIQTLTRAKWNEPVIRQKSNYLTAAETMFKRGLMFLTITALITAGITILPASEERQPPPLAYYATKSHLDLVLLDKYGNETRLTCSTTTGSKTTPSRYL